MYNFVSGYLLFKVQNKLKQQKAKRAFRTFISIAEAKFKVKIFNILKYFQYFLIHIHLFILFCSNVWSNKKTFNWKQNICVLIVFFLATMFFLF